MFLGAGAALLLPLASAPSSHALCDGEEGGWDLGAGLLTAAAFVAGGLTSLCSGYVGMLVAVHANVRCAVAAAQPEGRWKAAFNTAFMAGGVMGYALVAMELLVLYALCNLFALRYADWSAAVNSDSLPSRDSLPWRRGVHIGGSSPGRRGRQCTLP